MSYRVRNPSLHQEEDVIPAWKVGVAVLGALVISAVLIVWAVSLVGHAAGELRPSGVFPEQWLGPRHTVARVRQDLFDERHEESLNARQRRELESYGWVDRERGVVRIPIAKAIDLYLEGRQP